MTPQLVSLIIATACPSGMVWAGGRVCIDELPMSMADGHPRLGLSATRESYVPLRGVIWDLESLCAARGARMCSDAEWQSACDGTPVADCPSHALPYRVPDWTLVGLRAPRELARLDRSSHWRAYPSCVSTVGARMMGTIQEWVRTKRGYAFSRRFWSRAGTCSQFISSHAPDWHDYATGGRCCVDVR